MGRLPWSVRRPARLSALALSGLLLSFALGCAGDSTTETPTLVPALPEDWLADSLVLTLLDFPVGWSTAEADAEDDNPAGACLGGQNGLTGGAGSPSFGNGGTASVQHSILVFKSASEAEIAMNGFRGRLACYAAVINDGGLDNDDARFTDASLGGLSIRPHGDAALGFRMTVVARSRDKEALLDEVEFFSDFVLVRSGRLISLMMADDVFSPFDPQELMNYSAKAEAKLSASPAR